MKFHDYIDKIFQIHFSFSLFHNLEGVYITKQAYKSVYLCNYIGKFAKYFIFYIEKYLHIML